MNEELRAIRAEEAVADVVYAAHYDKKTEDEDDGEDWFLNALAALAP